MPSCKAFGPWEEFEPSHFWRRKILHGSKKHTQLCVKKDIVDGVGSVYRVILFAATLSDVDKAEGVEGKRFGHLEEALSVADGVAIRAGFELQDWVSRFDREEVI